MNKKSGFTLIELMVVIAAIAILSTIALFGATKAQALARDVKRQQIMNGVRSALERYYADNQVYPTGVSNFYTLINTTLIAYLGTVPQDPCANGTTILSPGQVTCGGVTVTYTYSSTTSTYSLVLTKEGGGTNTFTNPQ